MKRGIWTEQFGGSLEGKTLGIIGLGAIGTKAAHTAKVFNMNVLAWGPRLTAERAAAQGLPYVSLERLLRQSDFITIHVRLSEETRNLITEQHFGMMKETAFLINTSRGQVIDEEALIRTLREKRIGGAGLDVFSEEPLRPDHPLLQLDNVILSPHIGWKTDHMLRQFMKHAVENIVSYMLMNNPVNVINLNEIR
jgi:phosphoglycerate dehydrogenase-like enzyme